MTTNNMKFDPREVAEEVFRNGDPWEYITNEISALHVGDVLQAETLMLSAVSASVVNSPGVNIHICGASGKGKTHLAKTILHLMPHNQVYRGGITPYNRTTLDGFNVTFIDAQSTPTTPLSGVWWRTTTDRPQHVPPATNAVCLDVDAFIDVDTRVLEHQLNLAASGMAEFPESNGVLVCREMFAILQEMQMRVCIPDVYRIEWNPRYSTAELITFLELVKASALLDHRYRKMDCDTGLIRATISDITLAALYDPVRKEICKLPMKRE